MSGVISETGNRKPESSEEALEKFIESKIPKHLRENYGHDISMLRGGWAAAMNFVRASAPRWRRQPPDEIGLWWWWNEDEDSAPIPVDIAISGGINEYFATAGQHGWNIFQLVTDMGGIWMQCLEPALPNFG